MLYTDTMKAFRIFLLIIIIIGTGLLLTRSLWLAPLVDAVLRSEDVTITPYQPIPTAQKTAANMPGVILGKVLISPTCPVERIPADPKCAPKGYATQISMKGETLALTMTTTSKADGSFISHLPAGKYTFTAGGKTLLPRCQSMEVTVTSNVTQQVTISCDSGIR
jgi:hypothetical protein